MAKRGNNPGKIQFDEWGNIIGWKYIYALDRCTKYIVKLRIPSTALVRYQKTDGSSVAPVPVNEVPAQVKDKMRASEAQVLEIQEFNRDPKSKKPKAVDPKAAVGISPHDRDFLYLQGKTVKPKGKFSMSKDACTSGIHFFATRGEATQYGKY